MNYFSGGMMSHKEVIFLLVMVQPFGIDLPQRGHHVLFFVRVERIWVYLHKLFKKKMNTQLTTS